MSASLSRRTFTAGALALAASPGGAWGQQPVRKRRIGWLSFGSESTAFTLLPYRREFAAGMSELGWIEGRDFELVARYAENDIQRQNEQARELAALELDAIMAGTSQSAVAAKQSGTSVPIIFAAATDPLQLGLAASYNRPAGNVTGVTATLDGGFGPKQLELGREAFPKAARVGMLLNATIEQSRFFLPATRRAAESLGLEIILAEIRVADELEGAFARFVAAKADFVLALGANLLLVQAIRIAALAAKASLAVVGSYKEEAVAGHLLSYGANLAANYRRAAYFVDRILKGTKPADLPIEFPTTFDLVVNLKTAKALGVTLPEQIMIRATEVIE